jgi:hypothetical protein
LIDVNGQSKNRSRPSARWRNPLPPLRSCRGVAGPEKTRGVYKAIFWSVGCGIAACLLVIIAFASALLDIEHERSAAALFKIARGLFTAAPIHLA